MEFLSFLVLYLCRNVVEIGGGREYTVEDLKMSYWVNFCVLMETIISIYSYNDEE